MTDRHRDAARALLDNEFVVSVLSQRLERIASKLAELEAKAKTVAVVERQIVGNTDRWIIIDKTSPSGKTLFVCRSCGAVSPAPNKTCSEPVQLWNGQLRACADWVPPQERKTT